jgi:adenylate kinase family enzyme
MQKTIHLIIGAPLSGKICKAKELAKQLSITWISTDDI